MNDIELGMKPDVQTTLAVTRVVRKTRRVFLGCCKGPQTDKGVTQAPRSIVDTLALATCKF